ncbi:hypothetical protein HGRIS_002882 [Hohenbuehelia grisea]|uniref:Uncharacterized protein n=1 Tax=Hohenbuehelia grisea TaxID=104357 RepID=A0ABR3JLT3_9AGAR
MSTPGAIILQHLNSSTTSHISQALPTSWLSKLNRSAVAISSESGPRSAAIIGGVIGGIVFLLLVAVSVFILRRRRLQRRHRIVDPNMDIKEAERASIVPFIAWGQHQPDPRIKPTTGDIRMGESFDPSPPPLPPSESKGLNALPSRARDHVPLSCTPNAAGTWALGEQ